MSDSNDWTTAELAVRAALATHTTVAHLAEARLVRIDGRLSNFAWQAIAAPHACFVRLARAGTEALGADLHAEGRILQLVSAAGSAPAMLCCDPAARLLVTQWIEPGRAVPALSDPRAIQQVAGTLAQLHGLVVPGDLRRIRFNEQARLLGAALPASPALRELMAVAGQVFARLAAEPGPLSLCHHDLHAQNTVFDAAHRLWLVDWEYAGLNDPVFDLASYASLCDLTPAARRWLCEAYRRAGGVVEEGRLDLALWAFDLVQWLWYEGLRSGNCDGPGLEEAVRRSERIEQSLLARASVVLRCNNRGFDHND